MRRVIGQVARALAGGVFWVTHHLLQMAFALVVLIAVGVGALAWRLSEGPMQIGWLARRAEQWANADPGAPRVTIRAASLAWTGWREGLSQPLAIHLDGIAAAAPDGADLGHVESAEVTLSPGWLLVGQFVPRTIDLRGVRLDLERKPDGSIVVAHAPPLAPAASAGSPAPSSGVASAIAETAKPPGGDHEASADKSASPWSQIRRLRVRDAVLAVADRKLGFDFAVPRLAVDLRRRAQGGVDGDADARIVIADQTLHLIVHAAPVDGGAPAGRGETALAAQLDAFDPARLASAAPAFAPLAALDAPVALTATATLDNRLSPRAGGAHATLGAGKAHVGDGILSFLGADLDATAKEGGDIDAKLVKLELSPRPDGPKTTVSATLSARPAVGGKYALDTTLDLDRVAFADLPALWPAGLGGPGLRPWITKNITAGSAHDLHIKASLLAPADLSDAVPTAISGGFDGSDLTVAWLRPVPPIEHGEARLSLVDPDTIDIAVSTGHQVVPNAPGIAVKGGEVKITGLSSRHQVADIDVDLAGGLADLLTTLKNPRIKLLDKSHVDLRDPAGKFTGHLAIAKLPLESNVSMDDLKIKAKTHLTDVHLGAIAAGKDLDNGALDLDASNDGLHVQGTAAVAAIPANLAVDMDFRSGPPSQVLMKVVATATADEKQMAAAGLDPAGIVAGPASLDLTYENRRNSSGDIVVHADLSRASVTVGRAGYSKPVNAPASGDASIVLDHDRIVGIDKLHFAGDGILIDGAADTTGGRPSVVRLAAVRIGTGTDLHGEIRLPAKPDDGYGVTLAGPSLDLTAYMAEKPKPEARKPDDDDAPGPKYDADIKIGRVVLGPGRDLRKVSALASNDGHVMRRAEISGATGDNRFRIDIKPVAGGRSLAVDISDFGALLRAADETADIVGGHLAVEGRYDDRTAAHALAARAELLDFRVRGQAAFGKILQAMSLYGVFDALSGPGLNFTRMEAPFEYARGVLTLDNLRAFSSSLGMTAKGRVDLDRRAVDLQGTVVPAYFFNSLLGKIPFLGAVFSPERGGGVFSATYSVRGPFDDPSVSVNPLAALTPGFLRGIFGVFDTKPGK